MPYPRFQAPPEAVERLKALQAREKELEAKKLAKIDVFAQIGYEPNCRLRYKVRAAIAGELGLDDPFDKRVTETAELPAPCGKCPQEQFHSATESDVLLGGAAGGGKSIALVAEGLKVCARYPGIRVLLLRRSYDELEESIFPALRKFGMGKPLKARWNGVKHQLTFPNGSLFRFRYLERVEDAARRQGGEYQLLLVDELTLMAPGIVDFLRYERIRSGGADIPVIGVRATSNPGGPSHGQVKSRYIEATSNGAHAATDDHGLTIRFIPAKSTDNPHLDEGYQARLDAIPDPERRAAMRDGDWDRFAGMMFCYDDKVEILTAEGWKLIPKVSQGEPVATLSPDGEMSFRPVTAVWQFPFAGELYVHEGRAVDFAVTPGHRMWAHGYNAPPAFRFIPVENLPRQSVHLRTAQVWRGEDGESVTISAPHAPEPEFVPVPGMCAICARRPPHPDRRGRCEACYRAWVRMGRPDDLALVRRRRLNPVENMARRKEYTFGRGDWCEVLGWYLSEGFTEKASSGSRYAGRMYSFGIAQRKDPAKRARIERLLHTMGLPFTSDTGRFRVSSTVLTAYFAQFGKAYDKFIPREILGWRREHLQRLFDALMAGDGCLTQPKRGAGADHLVYSTVSRQLADDVQELAIRLGRVAVISSSPPQGKMIGPCYRVGIYRTGHDRSLVKKDNIRRERYEGTVACVTVAPYHTVLVRRNGKPMWSGNSEFSDERHLVEPMALPASWRRYNGVDWGFAAPWAVLWGAVDEDGRVWVYRELYETQVGEAEQARKVLEAEAGEHVIARFADDAMWATRGDAKPIANVYADNGVHLTPSGKGPGSRVQGWQRIHSYLAEAPACSHHRAMGWGTCPKIHIFATCPNLRFELKALPHATVGNPEDADPKAADHASDALRYLLLNIEGGATFYDSPDPGRPLGAPAPLTPMGRFAMAETPGEAPKRAPGSEPNPRQGATQTWEEALASMQR